MDAAILTAILQRVCPLSSASVGDPNNPATWSFQAAPSATQAQKDAATALLATLKPNSTDPYVGAEAAVNGTYQQDIAGRAAVLNAQGQPFNAMTLLLQAKGVL